MLHRNNRPPKTRISINMSSLPLDIVVQKKKLYSCWQLSYFFFFYFWLAAKTFFFCPPAPVFQRRLITSACKKVRRQTVDKAWTFTEMLKCWTLIAESDFESAFHAKFSRRKLAIKIHVARPKIKWKRGAAKNSGLFLKTNIWLFCQICPTVLVLGAMYSIHKESQLRGDVVFERSVWGEHWIHRKWHALLFTSAVIIKAFKDDQLMALPKKFFLLNFFYFIDFALHQLFWG